MKNIMFEFPHHAGIIFLKRIKYEFFKKAL